MAQSEHMLDIAVIGAGPVGLASAAAVMQKLGANTKLQVIIKSNTNHLRSQPALLAAFIAGLAWHRTQVGCSMAVLVA